MQSDNPVEKEWAPCQQGEVGQLVQNLKQRRRARSIQRGAAVTTLLMMVGFAGYYFAGLAPRGDMNFGGIACHEVMDLADRFLNDSLAPDTTTRIRSHLAQCAACQSHIDEMLKNANRQPAEAREEILNRIDPLDSEIASGQQSPENFLIAADF